MLYEELKREKYIRGDGWLSELVSMDHEDVPFNCVHSYTVTIKPKRTRAMHYHKNKKEWIATITGKTKLVLKDIETEERSEKILNSNAKDLLLIQIPERVGHAIKNIGDKEASLVVFSEKPEDPKDTIDYEMEVD